MVPAGRGDRPHGVARTAAGPWFTEIDALNRAAAATLPWDSHQGPCDGSASFPDLGKAPYDGSTPVILYGPDCNQPVKPPSPPPPLGAGLGDAPRVEVALPKDPSDPMLRDWEKVAPGPVTFDGTPCSFPGHVWKSSKGDYWNMICALVRSARMFLGFLHVPQAISTVRGQDGKSPWARFTSNTSTLMRWAMADSDFTVDAETGA
eukprot:COSAG04_NODE_6510_length_1312_cov_1.080791_1_plen_204_part_10